MKRTIGFALVAALALALVGCAGGSATPSDPPASIPSAFLSEPSAPPAPVVPSSGDDESPVSSAPLTYSELTNEDPALTAKGDPPLTRDLQLLYERAYDFTRAFNLCLFQVNENASVVINGMTYHPISDPRFSSIEALRAELEQVFTASFVAESLLGQDSCVQADEAGNACLLEASGTENADYAGHVFVVNSRTPSRISLTATVYYAEGGYEGEPFYTAPADPERYTTQTYDFSLVNTADGWRFDSFAFLQA